MCEFLTFPGRGWDANVVKNACSSTSVSCDEAPKVHSVDVHCQDRSAWISTYLHTYTSNCQGIQTTDACIIGMASIGTVLLREYSNTPANSLDRANIAHVKISTFLWYACVYVADKLR